MIHLEIDEVPPSPNELRREYRHPQSYRRLRTAWEWMILAAPCATHRALLKNAARTNKMHVEVTIYHKKAYDPDNLAGSLKPVLDALKNVGFIKDDSAKSIELVPPKQVIGKIEKTLIRIGPIEKEKEDAA